MSLDTLLFSAPGSWAGDGLVACVWFGVNILLALAAWRWSRALFPHDGLLAAVAHALVLAWAAIVLVAIVLGSTGLLGGTLLLVSVASVAVAALFARRGQAPPLAAAPLVEPGEGPWLCVWGLLLAFWIGHVVTGGLMKFPHDWDSLNYHLPMVVQWLHAHSLYAPDCCHWYSPGNNELIALWTAAPFSGDFLVSLNNLPAAMLLACASVHVARHLGVSRPLSHLAGLAVICIPVVLNQLLDQENDVAVCALFFASVMYIFRHASRSREPSGTFPNLRSYPNEGITKPLSPCTQGERGWGEGVRPCHTPPANPNAATSACLLAATTIGLLAGIKFYAVGYAGLAGLAWVLLVTATRGWRAGALAAVAGLVGTALFAGYWYARNMLITGSPLYPKGMFGSPDVITLLYPDIAHTSFIGNRRPELFGLYLTAVWRMTGPCQLAAFLLVPVSLAWLLVPARWTPTSAPAARRRTFALLLAGCAILLLITPFAVENEPDTLNQMYWHYCPVRYGMCFLSAAVMAVAAVLGDLSAFIGRARRRLAWLSFAPHALLAVGVLVQMIAFRLSVTGTNGLLIAVNLALFTLVAALTDRLWPSARWLFLIALLVFTLLAGTVAGRHLSERWHRGFVANYSQTATTKGLADLDGAGPLNGKLCVLEHRCYPFFGSQRQWRICQPVYVPSPQWLFDYLSEHEVEVVAAQPRRPVSGLHDFRWFEECRAENPMAFRTIIAGPLLLYRFEPPGEPWRTR